MSNINEAIKNTEKELNRKLTKKEKDAAKAFAKLFDAITTSQEHCVICGAPVPEGRQVCPNCENK